MQDYEKLGVFYLGREVDPARGDASGELLLYDSRDLTTHAVCVGMTGSGKTGLCLALLEEAGIDGIPALCIDPKGDLANLLLTFPALAPADFEPWVDAGDAARKGVSVAELAAQTAASWQRGLEEWGQSGERIRRLRNAVDLAVYTPGSGAGLQLSVVRSFSAPGREVIDDAAALRDRVGTLVSGILALLGREVDPLQSREHVFLSHLFERTWRESAPGTGLDMAGLIGLVQRPPFDRVGAFDLETFFPAKERLELAMALNNLLASPGFAAWMEGEPLDVQRLLFTSEGKPRISILSIAHLNDAERMFIVSLVLNELIAWMRTQSGTSSLRALFYMDEIFGYFPPSANPPSKPPMLTLLKQGRAFGLGCVLATQNPVDLDYKGLSNAGTWFIGRLQTERDKQRVIEGLESAIGGTAASDRQSLDRMISGLAQRVFLMRNVHDDAPVLFQSRWALSFLRGPLTGPEISRLMADRKAAHSAPAAGASERAADDARVESAALSASGEPSPTTTRARDPAPPGVPEYFLPATSAGGSAKRVAYKPMIMGVAKLHFVDAKLRRDEWRTEAYLAPFSTDGKSVLWNEAQPRADLVATLERNPVADASFAPLPAAAMRAASYTQWGKALVSYLYESARAEVLVCDALRETSRAGESEGDFRSRLALLAREKRDAAVEQLRRKYAKKLEALEDRQRRAEERVARERAQLSQQRLQTAFSVGASIFGAFLGRKRLSVTHLNRAATAARAAGRIGRESGDVDRADAELEALRADRAELEREFDAEVAALERSLDAQDLRLGKVSLSPRKSDLAVEEVALVWAP
ncbi:MAG: ATP-binding protein [Steroidobacteraceae bacterium]|nr:ATP-binding protein [Steroidobacteraceae bacterium]